MVKRPVVQYIDWADVNAFYNRNIETIQSALTRVQYATCANCHDRYELVDGSMICSVCDEDWDKINETHYKSGADVFVIWINCNPRAGRRTNRDCLTGWLAGSKLAA